MTQLSGVEAAGPARTVRPGEADAGKTRRRPESPPGGNWRFQQRLAPYLFVSPFIVLFAVFMAYPLARSFWLAFHKTVGARGEVFVGLDNFTFLLGDRLFAWAILNTVMFAVAFVALQMPLALGLALMVDSKKIIGRSLFRLAFFSTHLVGGVFVAVMFSQLLGRRGPLNTLLSWLTFSAIELDWLGSPRLAMLSVLLASLWLSVGYAMVYLLAALQSVDRELYEAAAVDGAGAWQRFRHVTLPGIRRVLVILTILATIGAMQLFELPWILFGQSSGPIGSGLTIVMYLFLTGFGTGDLGYASAIGWVFVLIVLVLATLQMKLGGVMKRP